MRRLEGIRAGLLGGTEVLDLGVEWDDLGRVESRTDQNRVLPGSQSVHGHDLVDRLRIRQVKATTGEPTISTTYVGSLYEEKETVGTGSVEHHHYVIASGSRVALIVTNESSSRQTRYLHQDHIGSIAAVSDDRGQVVSRYYYDVFGRSVDEQGHPLGPGQRDQASMRGYTDHEQLDEVELIHANARVLDPRIGRFLSIDPALRVQEPQSLNAYGYVRSSPLALVDPTGRSAIGLVGLLDTNIGWIHMAKWGAAQGGGTNSARREFTSANPATVAEAHRILKAKLAHLGVDDLQPGDVLLTGDGGSAEYLKGTGEYGHGAIVLESGDGRVQVLSSDNRGIYIRDNADPAVGGRTFDVFRTEGIKATDLRQFALRNATEGGIDQYFANGGANVCTSVCARGLEAAGGPTVPRLLGGLVTPNALAKALGPPKGRIDVPLLGAAP